jgi:hypothetical protein
MWMVNTILSNSKEDPVTRFIDTIPFTTFGSDLGMRAKV